MSETKASRPTNGRLKWAAVLIGLMVVFAIWRNAQQNYRLPEELAGEWRSSDPRYADRSLELSQGYVSFGTGNGTATTGFIKEVKVSQEGGKTLYTIIYRDDEQENQLSLYYDSSRGQTIRFKNQPNLVWTKVPSS